jgi:flagellar protein FliO/FliZ
VGIETILQVGFSLLVVFGLMWGLAKVARRPLTGGKKAGVLSILHRQQLSRGAALAVVQVADRALILGVTDQQVSLLGETELEKFERHGHVVERREEVPIMPDEVLSAPAHPATEGRLDGSILSPRTWSSTLDFIRDRTTRH